MKKQARSSDEWELDPDPVWEEQQGCITPKPFFLRWWKAVAEKRYGSGDQWLQVGYQLGYVLKITDPRSGTVYYEPYGYGYDEILARESLGLANSSPLVFQIQSPSGALYQRLWDWLLAGENQDEN